MKLRLTLGVSSSVLSSTARISPPTMPDRIAIEAYSNDISVAVIACVSEWPRDDSSTGTHPIAPPSRPAPALYIRSRLSTVGFI